MKKETRLQCTPEMRAALNNVRTGDRITLAQIKANGPAGTVIIPTALAIEVK
jgi:hypothetical protein